MSRIRSKDTKPEMVVRRYLWHHGYRYRLHRKGLAGRPDIVIGRLKVAIFVNGCFWHQHGCKLTTRPKSNATFWNDKFDNNIVRDIKTQHQLSLMGIRVAVVWECSLRSPSLVLERLITFIRSDEETIEL